MVKAPEAILWSKKNNTLLKHLQKLLAWSRQNKRFAGVLVPMVKYAVVSEVKPKMPCFWHPSHAFNHPYTHYNIIPNFALCTTNSSISLASDM